MSLSPVVASESESTAAGSAISVAASSCREIGEPVDGDKNGNILPAAWFAAVIARIWPERQRAKMLKFVTGVRSDRTARAWAAGDAEPSASILAALLRSNVGDRVLGAIMAGSSAPWWRDLREDRIMACAWRDSRRQVEEQLKLALD